MSPTGLELQEKVDLFISRFVEAMDDDFNTAQALGVLFDTVRATNRFLAETKEFTPLALSLVAHVRNLFDESGSVLGLFASKPSTWIDGSTSVSAGLIEVTPEEIERFIIERSEARRSKNFKRGDEIRNLLLEKGIQLLDTPQGTSWKVK